MPVPVRAKLLSPFRASSRRSLVLALVAITVVGAVPRIWRAEHPRVGHLSADERSYVRLALNLAHRGRYTGPSSPLHWPPGAPLAFAVAAPPGPGPGGRGGARRP